LSGGLAGTAGGRSGASLAWPCCADISTPLRAARRRERRGGTRRAEVATGAGATGAAKVVRGDGRLAVAGPGKKDEVKKKVEKGRRDGTRGRRRQGGGGRRCVGAAIVAWAAVWARFAFDVAEHDLAWWHKRACNRGPVDAAAACLGRGLRCLPRATSPRQPDRRRRVADLSASSSLRRIRCRRRQSSRRRRLATGAAPGALRIRRRRRTGRRPWVVRGVR